ncbi:MAG: lytic transglycosylase domain-containing protein [Bryobacteraceae bacterium]
MTLRIGFGSLILLTLTTASSFAQAPEAPYEKALNAQKDSIGAQMASVEKQRAAAVPATFFVLPAPARTISPMAPRFDCDPMAPAAVDPLIQDASHREGLEEELVRGVIKQESAFRPCVVSPKGAMGLMQLMPATAHTLNVRDAFDPKQSIDAGARYLKELMERYKGDTALALAAYNAGPARVDKSSGVPAIAETVNYVDQIMRALPLRP